MVKDQEGDNRLSSVVGSVCLVHTKNSSSITQDLCLGVCPRVCACVHACVCASVCFAFFAFIQQSSFLYSAAAPSPVRLVALYIALA